VTCHRRRQVFLSDDFLALENGEVRTEDYVAATRPRENRRSAGGHVFIPVLGMLAPIGGEKTGLRNFFRIA
jgi:hypothetical protein